MARGDSLGSVLCRRCTVVVDTACVARTSTRPTENNLHIGDSIASGLLWFSRRRRLSRGGGQRLPVAGTRAKLYTRVRCHVLGWTRTRGIFHSLMIRDVLEAEYGGQLARRCRRPGAETGTRLLIRFRERDMRRQA